MERRVALTCLALFAGVSFLPAGIAGADSNGRTQLPPQAGLPPVPIATLVAHDVKLRAKLGLNSNPDFVQTLYTTRHAEAMGRDAYDMLLLEEEAAELRRRTEVDLLAAEVQSTLLSLPGDVYASHRIDNLDGGTLIVQTTAPDVAERETSARLAAVPHRFEAVQFGAKRQQSVREAIRKRAQGDNRFRLNALSSDVARNGIRLYVSGDVEAARATAAELAGAVPVDLVVEAADSDVGVQQADLPFRGGVIIRNNITSPYYSTKLSCTSGFTGYRNTVPTTYYILTAGHCGQPYEEFGQNTFSGTYEGYGRIGLMDVSGYRLNSQADAGRIRITDATYKSNRIIIAPNVTREITSAASVGTYGTGAFVCLSTTRYQDTDGDYFNCGTVDDGSYDSNRYDKYYNRNFSGTVERMGNYKCIGGDSGGPVIDGAKAVGTITARRDDGRCVFAHIYDVLVETGVHGVWPG